MEPGSIQNKLKLLFEKIAEPGYVLNNYYVDTLLTKLKSNDAEISYLEKVPVLPDLILNSLHTIDTAHITVKVFIIRVLALVSKNELHFTKIFTKKGEKIANEFSVLGEAQTLASTRVAYLEVALALTTHTSGAMWLMENNIWKLIYDLCHQNQTVFVLRQAYKFFADFLWRLSENDEEQKIVSVLDCILEPIQQNPYCNLNALSNDEEYVITKRMEPALHIIMVILNDNTKLQRITLLIKLLVKNYSISSHLFSILSLTHREEIMHLLAKLIFVLVLAKVFITKPMEGSNFNKDDFLELSVSYFNTIRFFVKRRLVVPLMDYCNTCCIIWSEFWSKSKGPTFEQNGRSFEFQSQLLFILLVPVLVYIKTQGFNRHDACDPMNQYITRLLNSSCEHTARAAYSIRHLMFESDPLAMTLHCVKRLSCLKNHLNNAGANLIFQALFYVLNNYVPEYVDGNLVEEDLEDSSNKVLVMTYVVDTIYRLVKNHDINWHDSLETVCIYNQIHSILKRRNLSVKFMVAALNLITITVKKFLPPSLSLLMESIPGSAIHDLGQLIFEKLHDRNWEVRDSALELLLVCTELSFVKYIPFQKQIIDNKLMTVAAAIGLNDMEFYAQTSALRCLGAASKVTAIWEHLLQHEPDVQEKLITQLCNNPEGIVRKEVIHVLSEMYLNLKLEAPFKTRLYNHMVSNAISDFHWEVQIAALQFWKIIIKSLLADEGMLDGTFPSVTFSKGTRKIVTLNKDEIQKRLHKTLERLSLNGCLTVLVKLLQEDVDVDIMEYSLNISLEFCDILKQYNVTDVGITNEVLTDNIEEVVSVETSPEIDSDIGSEVVGDTDQVIDGILEANDINLLSSIYERHMRLQNESSNTENNLPKIRFEKYVSPKLFLEYVSLRDYKSFIKDNRRWKKGIRNMSSLLDDILGIYECNEEVNDMDCY